MEHITGYSYEPWHIRYIDDVKIAKEITEKGLTLEEYLGKFEAPEVKVDYGKSSVYTKEQMDEDYEDYQWWLACDEEGNWDIVSQGY